MTLKPVIIFVKEIVSIYLLGKIQIILLKDTTKPLYIFFLGYLYSVFIYIYIYMKNIFGHKNLARIVKVHINTITSLFLDIFTF